MKNDSHFATLQSRETSIQTQCFEKYQKCLIKVEPILNHNSISFILDWKIPKLLSYKLQLHAIVSIPASWTKLEKKSKEWNARYSSSSILQQTFKLQWGLDHPVCAFRVVHPEMSTVFSSSSRFILLFVLPHQTSVWRLSMFIHSLRN